MKENVLERLHTENETLTAQLTASEAARADLGKRLAAALKGGMT